MTELVINEEFKRLIPSLSTEEMIALERSIIAEGCRDPLVTWNGYIIDGHHRYGICQKYNIEFTVVNKPELESELDVKLWMINNQFSRRNLATIRSTPLLRNFSAACSATSCVSAANPTNTCRSRRSTKAARISGVGSR